MLTNRDIGVIIVIAFVYHFTVCAMPTGCGKIHVALFSFKNMKKYLTRTLNIRQKD